MHMSGSAAMSNMGMHAGGGLGIVSYLIVLLCLLLVTHMYVLLRKHGSLLTQLRKEHSTLVHSIPMTFSMVSTLALFMIIGCVLKGHLGTAYVLGCAGGIALSVAVSLPFQDGIAVIDGMVSGAMGGLMGVMLGSMVPPTALYLSAAMMTMLFAAAWLVVLRRLRLRAVELTPTSARRDGMHATDP